MSEDPKNDKGPWWKLAPWVSIITVLVLAAGIVMNFLENKNQNARLDSIHEPDVRITAQRSPSGGGAGFVVKNVGAGLAKLGSTLLTVRGTPVFNWDQAVLALAPKGSKWYRRFDLLKPDAPTDTSLDVIPGGSRETKVIWFSDPKVGGFIWDNRKNIVFKVCFCDHAFDRCWERQSIGQGKQSIAKDACLARMPSHFGGMIMAFTTKLAD